MEQLRRDFMRLLRDPDARRDPIGVYRRLTAEAPVLDLGWAWVVAGYSEITALLTSPGVVVDPAAVGMARPGTAPISDVVSKMLPMRDGADHNRLKRLAVVAFSSRRVAEIRARVEAITDALVAPCLAARTFDLVADIAVPLPIEISCAILDVPAADRPKVTQWAALFTKSLLDPFRASQTDPALIEAEFQDLREYARWLGAQRLRSPGQDLVSHLAQARSAGVIDEDEFVAFMLMLFANGLETLTSGLAVAAWRLLNEPTLGKQIRDEPVLAEPAFDECQRLGSPVRASARALTRPVDLNRATLPAGSIALLLYAAANRDPRRFPDPDTFNPRRPDRRHLAFGHGPHHCLGAPLALMAGGIVLSRLAAVADSLTTELTSETAPWSEEFVFGGLNALPITRRTRIEVV